MFHESLRGIAARWKNQVEILKQRIDTENDKIKAYSEQLPQLDAFHKSLRSQCDEKKKRCYDNQVTLKFLEDSKIAATNSISHHERQLYLQHKSNQADDERYQDELSVLEQNEQELIKSISQISFRDLESFKARLEDLRIEESQAMNQRKLKRLELQRLRAKEQQNRQTHEIDFDMKLSPVSSTRREITTWNTVKDQGPLTIIEEEVVEKPTMKRSSYFEYDFDEYKRSKLQDFWNQKRAIEEDMSSDQLFEHPVVPRKVAKITGVVQPMRSSTYHGEEMMFMKNQHKEI